MSKTFKNATNSGTEVYVGEGINTDSVQLIIRNVGSGIGKAGIYLNSSDIPALALAILEAAGYKEHSKANLGSSELLASYGLTKLRQAVQAQEREESEAREQAKLEAEALELFKASGAYGSDRFFLKFSDLEETTQSAWLAVARRAREMRAEK